MIAIFCGRLRSGEQPTVFGDGLQTRDYIYVGDVVSAALAAAAGEASGAINIGTGVETTVLELVERLRELSGESGFEAEFAPAAPRRGAADLDRPRRGPRRRSAGPRRPGSRRACASPSTRSSPTHGDGQVADVDSPVPIAAAH